MQPTLELNVNVNLGDGLADAITFAAQCALAVGVLCALCGCRWCGVRFLHGGRQGHGQEEAERDRVGQRWLQDDGGMV